METYKYEMNPFTLAFKSPEVEGEFLGEIANRRWPVLIFIFCFDVFCFLFRFIAKWTAVGTYDGTPSSSGAIRPFEVLQEMGHQLANMAMLYVLIGLLNKRARKSGNNAARQEEVLLSICMGLAICNLLASLRADNAQDYVYMGYFLICTSTFLKIRWWVGTGLLATPTVALQLWHNRPPPSSILPPDAVVHIVVAWAVGGLMAYLNDWYRRQMYANARLASAAHGKEMKEATARIQAERELAAAQAQAAQRALIVAREKAAHEAKSEFMSLMCHEVRTPLNGCLASAEMLLETPLKEEQRELANTIRVSGSILLSTVSNFLDFFKLEAGKRLDIVRSEVCLSLLVGDVHCIIEAMIGRGGAVSLQQPQLMGVPDTVMADPDRLRGILLNLYTNAAKFTKKGHIVLRVSSVSRDFIPPSKPGYTAIMLQPTYHPSSSSHRSMDISSCIIMAPASDHEDSSKSMEQQWDSNQETSSHQQQQQQQQHSLMQSASYESLDPAAVYTDSIGVTQQQQQRQQEEEGKEDQCMLAHDQSNSPTLQDLRRSLLPAPQQQQPFWHQAREWALKLLSSGSAGELAAAAATTTADSTPLLDNSSSRPLSVTTKSDSFSGGSSKGVQYDVHADSSASESVAEACLDLSSVQQASNNSSPEEQQQQCAVPPPTPPAAAASSAGRRRTTSSSSSSSGSEDPCWLLFEVEDSGVGITRDGLALLFREYVQGTDDEMCKPRTRGGTGLGLSICSKQVGVLGGVIGAQSCRGRGSTFWFKIPTYGRPIKHRNMNSSKAEQQQQQQPPVEHLQHHGVGQHEPRPHHQQPQSDVERDSAPATEQLLRSGSNSSNIGTYDVIHSGLYHSTTGQRAEQLCNTEASAAAAPPPPPPSAPPAGASNDPTMASAQPAATSNTQAPSSAAAGASSITSCQDSTTDTSLSAAKPRADSSQSSPSSTAAATCLSAKAAAAAAGKPPQHPSAPTAATTSSSSSTPSSTASTTAAPPRSAPRQSLSLDGRAPEGPALDTQLLTGQRVLLAEDNLINQTVARKMLNSLGMQVQVAANGLEALNEVQRAASSSSSNMFALVLMDMAMPVMGGVEATREIRAAGYDLPIVAMTANASDRDREECAAAGMNGFLSKPVLRDQLARAMLAALKQRAAAAAAVGGSGGCSDAAAGSSGGAGNCGSSSSSANSSVKSI